MKSLCLEDVRQAKIVGMLLITITTINSNYYHYDYIVEGKWAKVLNLNKD